MVSKGVFSIRGMGLIGFDPFPYVIDIWVSINGCRLITENPFQMDDLGVPLFQDTPIYLCTYLVGAINPLRDSELAAPPNV